MSDKLFIKIMLIIISLTMCIFTLLIVNSIKDLEDTVKISLKN